MISTAPELAAALLSAYIDFTAETRELIPVVASDPAVHSLLEERLPRSPDEMTGATIAALAGPRPSRAATIRAHAALPVVKDATLAALATGNGRLNAMERGEILAAALHALQGEGMPARA